MKLKNFKWWHWLFLGVYSVYMAWMGVGLLVQGAAPASRFYAVDNIVIRMIGAGMFFFAFAPFSGRRWAFRGAIAVLLLKILETLITFDANVCFPEHPAYLAYTALSITIFLMDILPLLVLLWLGHVISRGASAPSSPAMAPPITHTHTAPLTEAERSDNSATLPPPLPIKRAERLRLEAICGYLIALLALAMPFLCGFFGLSQAWLFLAVPVSFAGLAGGIILVSLAWHKHRGLAVAATILLTACVVTTCRPAGAAAWTLGFAWNVKLTKEPDQIQSWAAECLDDYETGSLPLNTNYHRWGFLSDRIDDSRIPSLIRKAWSPEPCVGIVTIEDTGYIIATRRKWAEQAPDSPYPTGTTNAVIISWYLHGLLVGRPEFKSKWNPWYLHEIKPGIYAFCGMK